MREKTNELPQLDGRLELIEGDQGARDDFATDVLAGLTAPRKRLSCRYLYDAAGSELFERICDLPEYYLTRAEQSILDQQANELARLVPPNGALVELGSGSARKTRTLIEALLRQRESLEYVPIDISRSMLEESSQALLADYPALQVTAIAAEYRAGLRLLDHRRAQPKLVLWLGSNVGNFSRGSAGRFLTSVRAALAPDDRLLMGVDLRKERAVLEAAYDDAAGVTAAFNLNLLTRINRELGGHFDLDQFAHRARWLPRAGRVAIHIVSRRAQTVPIDALDRSIAFDEGETIFTESSYKYSIDEVRALARHAGFVVERCWLDGEQRFSLNLLAPLSA